MWGIYGALWRVAEQPRSFLIVSGTAPLREQREFDRVPVENLLSSTPGRRVSRSSIDNISPTSAKRAWATSDSVGADTPRVRTH